MAWTAPMTAVAGTVFTAADFNTYVRDNMNETAVAKATTAGRVFVATGLNALAERTPTSNTVNNVDTSTVTSYADLTNPGPTITATTGPAALVHWSARLENDTAGQLCHMSIDISGATTTAASDNWALSYESSSANDIMRAGTSYYFSLTAGSNTFTTKYRVTGGTGTFRFREMWVFPL